MCRDNASSYYVTSVPDAASLAIHALAIGSLKWRSNSTVCVRASIDRTGTRCKFLDGFRVRGSEQTSHTKPGSEMSYIFV